MGQRKEAELLLLFFLLAISSSYAWCLYLRWSYRGNSSLWTIPVGLYGLSGTLGALVTLHMRSKKPSDNHSITTLLWQYSQQIGLKAAGFICYPMWERSTWKVGKAQEQLLMAIFDRQKDTEYGKMWNFSEINSVQQFQNQHPLTDYSHYKEMIERAAQGEKNILTRDEVNFIALTSGTTGKNKKYIKTSFMGGSKTIATFIAVHSLPSPSNCYLRRSLWFILPARPRTSEAGIPMGPASAKWVVPPKDNVYPPICQQLTQEGESYYAQAVFALADVELGSIQAFSPNLLYTFFKFIMNHINELTKDIERGSIGEKSPIKDPSIRASLSEAMSPNPVRALHIRKEVSRGQEGLARRLWPFLGLVSMAKSGGFAHCAKLLETTFLKGVISTCHGHGSSEAWCGMNLNVCDPDKDTYTFVTQMTLFEFIPLEEVDSEMPKTYLIEEVRLGECYELVVTTYNGLYRFRLGDIVRIVGYFNDTPQYEFCYRLGQRLNLTFERTPESCIYQSVQHLAAHLPPGVIVEDYTATESHVLEGITGERNTESQYIFIMEILHERKEEFKLDQEHMQLLDTCIRENHAPYDVYRSKGSIGPIRVLQVKRGSFEEVKHVLWDGFQNQQFKMPRVIRREKLLRSLMGNECQFNRT